LHELLPTKQNTPRQVNILEELSDTLHYARMKYIMAVTFE